MAHIILLTWKKLFRDKINTFWILCFPIVLGTLFYISFSNMAEDENINPIPVAVVLSDDEYSDAFKTALQDIEDSDDSMLNVNFCTADEAMDSLENQEIRLKRGVPKNFCYKTKLIALLVQALKALKQQNVGQEEIQTIRSLISKEPDKTTLAKDVDMMPIWMKRIVKPMLLD